MKYLPPKWTGKLVGKMHNNCVSIIELSKELGVNRTYVSMILGGTRTPINAEQNLTAAYERILERRKDG